MTGRKSERTLKLEKESSQERLHAAQTIGECLPELSQIARDHGLDLTRPAQYKEAVSILRNPR